jgi:ribose-phosphate pyrophosphokinase
LPEHFSMNAERADIMTSSTLSLFAPESSRVLGQLVAARLGVPLSPLEERDFEDGEHKVRPLESVRGRDAYVVHSLYGEPGASANDKLVRLLFLIGALRDAGAHRVSAVVPYLCYARKDARTQARDPVSSRYVAQLFEAMGTDRVVVTEVHNPAAFHNAFRIRADHLATAALFADHLASVLAGEDVVVVSPDPGGFKRAQRLHGALSRRLGAEVGLGLMEKTRARGRLSSGRLVGDVAGCTAVIVDDIVASGATLLAAAEACRAHGSRRVLAVATHGLFVSPASETIAAGSIERVVVTDSVPAFRLDGLVAREKVDVVSIAPLLAEAISRLHEDGSISELIDLVCAI